MSYCRFSSDNFKCDVYCYESSEGFITHVAGKKIVGELPPLPELGTVSDEEFVKALTKQHETLLAMDRVPIGLPYDSQTLVNETLPEMLERLNYLKEIGYNVPDWVLTRIKEEIKETP